jgi:hypothetical protein
MINEHAKRVLKLAKGLFPALTTDQAELLLDRLKPYDVQRALAVVRTHAANNEWLSIPKLLQELKNDDMKFTQRRRDKADITCAAWLRTDDYRSFAARGAVNPRGSDWQILFDHFSQSWQAVEQNTSSTSEGKAAARIMIRAHARRALIDAGFSDEDAAEFADGVVALAPGEKLRRIEVLGAEIEEAQRAEGAQLR